MCTYSSSFTRSDAFTNLLLPVKLLEYVHMGLPVVCSRLRGVQRYFGDDDLRFAEPGSASSFADALEEVCADPGAAAARAEHASRRLAEMRWEQQRQVYLDTIDRVAAERAARRALRTRAPGRRARSPWRSPRHGLARPACG
jgi:glycosyltransferase involved in cell wall biosynthesis